MELDCVVALNLGRVMLATKEDLRRAEMRSMIIFSEVSVSWWVLSPLLEPHLLVEYHSGVLLSGKRKAGRLFE